MKKLTTKEFILSANLIHDNFYNYDKTIYLTSRINLLITCPIHGDFSQKANNHLNGAGCTKCRTDNVKKSKTLTLEKFIEKSNIIHNFKYSYINTNYINSRLKVNIICPIHGEFLQVPNSHLIGIGCNKCSYLKYNGGWKLNEWKIAGENSKNFDSFKVYIIKCWDENEEFYKIGRTFLSIIKRFKNRLPYNYEIIKIIKGSAKDMYVLENNLKNINKHYKYIPLKKFGGNNECFKKLK